MRTTWKKRLMSFLISLTMALSVVTSVATPVSAMSSSDVATVTRNDSFKKDDKFYMSFNIKNVNYDPIFYGAKLYNASGKVVFTWKEAFLAPGESIKRDYGADYANLPTGTYTFRIYVGGFYYWNYKINHTNKSSISFKSYETYYADNGYYKHKFNIQCTGMKGTALTIKIYDAYGDFVYQYEGPKRKTNNEVGWFTWSGYQDGVKLPSGEYTVIVTGGGKTIQKTYKLNILEVTRG